MANTKKILLLDEFIIERIIQLKKEKNIKNSQLAELLDTEESFIRKVETKVNKYNIHHILLLPDYFGVSINDFFPNERNWKGIKFSKKYKSFTKCKSFEELYNAMKNEIKYRKHKEENDEEIKISNSRT